MPIIPAGIVNLIVILAIGLLLVLCLIATDGVGRGRRVADVTGVGDVTYSLAGIADFFIAFHIAAILRLPPTPASPTPVSIVQSPR